MAERNAYIAVVPARFGSSRLPGKPLLDIAGEPMVAHVWRRAGESAAERVVVATDDERIREALKPYGAEVILTRSDHPSGTDRLAEVAERLGLADDAVLVNVQGDEPLIPPRLIDQVAQRLHDDPGASIATLAEPIGDVETLFNPNVVKVVRSLAGRALYFSRAPIPGTARPLPHAPSGYKPMPGCAISACTPIAPPFSMNIGTGRPRRSSSSSSLSSSGAAARPRHSGGAGRRAQPGGRRYPGRPGTGTGAVGWATVTRRKHARSVRLPG